MSEESVTQVTDEKASIGLWERWDRIKTTERFPIVVAIGFVSLWSWFFARSPIISDVLRGYHSLATTILVWSIFAIGFNLLLHQTGYLSFGHAMFWGVGSYAAALLAIHVYGDPLLMLSVGTGVAVLLAAITGLIALRLHTVYFSIVTLAMAQILYYLSLSPLDGLTGGDDGLTGVPVEPLFFGVGNFYLQTPLPGVFHTLWQDYQYLLIAVVFVAVVAFVNRVRRSPYGLIFKAIRENERRAALVGVDVWRYKFAAYLMSGAITGLAGALLTIESQSSLLSSLYWLTSGEVVVMAILGGAGSVFGPVIGAGVFLYFDRVFDGIAWAPPLIGDITGPVGQYWLLILTALFTVVVAWSPQGIVGLLKQLAGTVRSKLEAATRDR
ncbi:branched-chain amino acid ABC transporter permease [Natronococcus occultus]|uniref:Amino acid/amide ABC transporter membrane protein 2, HAAT family n=1 Tax=Natronococcus occultus SP4 TaxID=694430 RepID=L0K445_9EURY|nr:branched-chain amino acid ABC transporter permease [Natronococcus occultus]AGB38873.1 amino acid/amide ABC transporter membrane protein 2, HAAT family [Natronococcus occultus SP4]